MRVKDATMKRFLLAASFVLLNFSGASSAQEAGFNPARSPEVTTTAEGQNRRRVGEEASGQPTGSIKGRVLNETGQALVNALVLARPAGRPGPVSMTSTDSDGNFQMRHLEHTAYQLTAIAAGYVAAQDSQAARHQTDYYTPGDAAIIEMMKGGVVTGKVTSQSGEPIVAARVRAVRMRDGVGNRVPPVSTQRQWLTDDRGAYRIYGLAPGSYVIAVSNSDFLKAQTGAHNDLAPTYYPSTTHESAVEVVVGNGQETGGIDVRLLAAQAAYTVSGSVSGAVGREAPPGGILLTLSHFPGNVPEASTSILGDEGHREFMFYGVPEGEYELTAQGGLGTDAALFAFTRRLTVKDASVAGVELTLARLGSIAGRVVVESVPQSEGAAVCQNARPAAVEETVIAALFDKTSGQRGQTFSMPDSTMDSAVDTKGNFVLRNLGAGRVYVATRLPTQDWYVSAVTFNGSSQRGANTSVSNNGLTLKAGERLEGLTIKIAEGGAALRGKVSITGAGDRHPVRLSVHLVPSSPAYSDDATYFAEATIQEDGTFVLSNLAPGRYSLIARKADDERARPVAWDAEGRERLRRETKAASAVVELRPCQRIINFSLNYLQNR